MYPLMILGRDKVKELFIEKRKYLKSVFERFQDEIDGRTYQTPDNGWQVNFRHDQDPSIRDNKGDNFAAITLRPGDTTAHEVHGGICGRWYAEGGAWDNGKKGWLGWPISDEEPCGCDNRISLFENGTIFWDAKRATEQIPRSWEDTVSWLKDEAAHGLAWAQARLGDCFMRGLGVTRDYGLAFKWLSVAKENGAKDIGNNSIEAPLQQVARLFILSL